LKRCCFTGAGEVENRRKETDDVIFFGKFLRGRLRYIKGMGLECHKPFKL
jgi:hypothetical protein